MEHAEAFLRDQISPAQRALIPATLKAAYDAAKLATQDDPIFNVPSALDNRGRVIQWSVDLAFDRLVKSGKWPFDVRWRQFERPTGRYLEIRPSHCVLTISQVADPRKQPRDVQFRANKRLSGQGWLEGLAPEVDSVNGVPHVLLLHGHQSLNFAYLGLPKGNHASGYHYRSPNLMLLPHALPEPEVAIEDTDIDAVLTLKDEIDRWRKDHGE